MGFLWISGVVVFLSFSILAQTDKAAAVSHSNCYFENKVIMVMFRSDNFERGVEMTTVEESTRKKVSLCRPCQQLQKGLCCDKKVFGLSHTRTTVFLVDLSRTEVTSKI